MPEQKETETDRLADVIAALQLGRKTGTLTVARNLGTNLEEGTIIFVNGQPVWASVGQFISEDALNWLAGWGACRFNFVPSISPGIASPNISTIRSYSSSTAIKRSTGLSPSMLPPDRGGKTGLPLSIPSRLRSLNEAMYVMEKYGFSRMHRRLFLLLDGQRTLPDLVLLMGRRPNEVYELLDQLAQAGLIKL